MRANDSTGIVLSVQPLESGHTIEKADHRCSIVLA